MTFDRLTLLWARYDELDRLATEAEAAGNEEKLAQARRLLAACAALIVKAQGDADEEE